MRVVLAGRGRAIVAGHAVAADTRVIKYRTLEAGGVMAIVTGIAAGDMIGRFAGRRAAIMTAETGALHFSMIDSGCRLPQICAVTRLTATAGVDMRIALAGRRCPVVTGYAVTAYATMVECRSRPGGRIVAIAADIATGNVVRRFAGRRGAIVATEAGALHFSMID